MKTTKIFSVLAIALVMLTGCQDDDFGKKYGPAKVGDEIIFGGTAGYEPEGRTVYGDKVEGENGYTEIKWYTGDKVRIYCAQAQSVTDKQYADYNIVNGLSATESPYGNGNEPTHSSALSAMGSGLKWGSSTEQHIFYGVYPAPAQLEVSGADELSKEAAGKLELNGNTLKGFLPNRQTPISGKANYTYANGTYTIHPSMRYAYMVARNPVSPSTGYANLKFEPIVTAVEITLKNVSVDVDDNGTENSFAIKNIEAFRVSSNEVICGEFTTNIGDDKTNTVTSTGDAYKQIFIPTNIDSLAYGESVKFTAFLMLDNSVSSLNELMVTIITSSGQKSAKVNGKSTNNKDIIVQAKKKNFLTNIPLNLGEVITNRNSSNWIKYIPNTLNNQNVLVRSLSIPGAGGAASYPLFNDYPEYAQQSLTIAEQWNQGIRCFEFAVDRPGATANTGLLADEEIICAGRKTGVKLGAAVDAVKSCLLASPEEFAMVIITYENLGGWSGTSNVERNPATFMTALRAFWEGYNDVAALYNPESTTVASARGKLFCIARPTSNGQDDLNMEIGFKNATFQEDFYYVSKVEYNSNNLQVENHSNILVVNGWGSLKDKWVQRGYTSCVFHRGTSNPSNAPDYVSGAIGRPFDVSTFTDGNGKHATQSNYKANTTADKASFSYNTQVGTSKKGTAWIQEWARVSPSNFLVQFNKKDANNYQEAFWASTIEEKELRIAETLDYALDKEFGDILYINSLCGYFIDANIAESYKPHTLTDYSGSSVSSWGTRFWKLNELTASSEYAGMEGNIDAYAKHINNYFYKLLSEKQTAGDLDTGIGIVMMDRVSNSAEKDPAGYYIPQIIWSNNKFK